MKQKSQFAAGVLTGAMTALLVVLACLCVFSLKYEDTALSIYIMAKNAVLGPVKGEAKEASSGNTHGTAFSGTQVAAKLNMLNAYVEQFYFKEGDAEAEKEAVCKAFVDSLGDPYSVYYTAKEYQSMNENFEGSYIGIGISLSYNQKSGQYLVDEVQDGSGAADAGMKQGDILCSVEGKSVDGMEIEAIVELIRGEENSTVNIGVKRENEELEFTVKRQDLEMQTVEYKCMEGQVGYIQIIRFAKNTSKQFCSALDTLEKQGIKSLLVDLRDNGGGSLSAVVEVLDRLLPKGMLVYTRTKDGKEEEYKSTDKQMFDLPLCVLINENSASASEIFAGAVKDRKAGTLVGTTSYGKGIVQKVYVLDDGSAVKLTNSEYFTPNGNNIHGVGIEPDLQVKQPEASAEDLQLQKALEILKK